MGDGGEHSAMQVETRTKVGRGVERLRPRTPFRSMLAGMLTSFNMALTQAWWGKHVGSTLASGCMSGWLVQAGMSRYLCSFQTCSRAAGDSS